MACGAQKKIVENEVRPCCEFGLAWWVGDTGRKSEIGPEVRDTLLSVSYLPRHFFRDTLLSKIPPCRDTSSEAPPFPRRIFRDTSAETHARMFKRNMGWRSWGQRRHPCDSACMALGAVRNADRRGGQAGGREHLDVKLIGCLSYRFEEGVIGRHHHCFIFHTFDGCK